MVTRMRHKPRSQPPPPANHDASARPNTKRIPVVHTASFTVTQSACQSISWFPLGAIIPSATASFFAQGVQLRCLRRSEAVAAEHSLSRLTQKEIAPG
ncbi:hypothetical protein HRbin36_01179 [bacterium HR36]|nr:hypothetical protein HRbin36_01179 [bacterium HR36]